MLRAMSVLNSQQHNRKVENEKEKFIGLGETAPH